MVSILQMLYMTCDGEISNTWVTCAATSFKQSNSEVFQVQSPDENRSIYMYLLNCAGEHNIHVMLLNCMTIAYDTYILYY